MTSLYPPPDSRRREGRTIPLYEYQCECGLQFERPGKATRATETRECPNCGDSAKRLPPSGLGYTFNHAPTTSGPVPQNTGVSSFDLNVDRVIGEDAEEKRGSIELRNSRKREVLRAHPGATEKDLARLPNGDYQVINPVAKRRTRNRRAFHNAAMATLKQDDHFVESENRKFNAGQSARYRAFRRQRGRA